MKVYFSNSCAVGACHMPTSIWNPFLQFSTRISAVVRLLCAALLHTHREVALIAVLLRHCKLTLGKQAR